MGCFSHIKLLYKLLFVAFITSSGTFGALFQRPQDLPKTNYDFIVVGGICPAPYTETLLIQACLTGGTAGAVIANRLTENPNVSVLILEAGNAYVDLDEIHWAPAQKLGPAETPILSPISQPSAHASLLIRSMTGIIPPFHNLVLTIEIFLLLVDSSLAEAVPSVGAFLAARPKLD